MKKLLAITALSALVACQTTGNQGASISPETSFAITAPRIITMTSRNDFDTTLAQAQAAIDARGFKTFAVIDHAAGAASIGQSLLPTTLIIFGNPKGGTPLMQANSQLGLELPLRLLVRTNDKGIVEVTTEDMALLFEEYGIDGLDENLKKISGALKAISADATGVATTPAGS